MTRTLSCGRRPLPYLTALIAQERVMCSALSRLHTLRYGIERRVCGDSRARLLLTKPFAAQLSADRTLRSRTRLNGRNAIWRLEACSKSNCYSSAQRSSLAGSCFSRSSPTKQNQARPTSKTHKYSHIHTNTQVASRIPYATHQKSKSQARRKTKAGESISIRP